MVSSLALQAATTCILLSLQSDMAFAFVPPISRVGRVSPGACIVRGSRTFGNRLLPAATHTRTALYIGIGRKEQHINATAANLQESFHPAAAVGADRFDKVATSTESIPEPCIFTINGVKHNMTAWASAHPGGKSILMKFHGKDATKAFAAAGHSQHAFDMLNEFAMKEEPSVETNPSTSKSSDRFDQIATSTESISEPCIVTINGVKHNMTAWANAHPGGKAVLMKFHGKDATKAFAAAGHSQHALDMLNEFAVQEKSKSGDLASSTIALVENRGILKRIRSKLFTKEDPIGIHKYCGIFSLLHFAYRYIRCVFGDPAAGFGKGSNISNIACLLPHAMLSLSSLIFHTVPRERVVGRPMIWQEYRIHNIIFGMRSILCTFFAWLAIYKPALRKACIIGSSMCVMSALKGADIATEKLRHDESESTTATMPYVSTVRRYKTILLDISVSEEPSCLYSQCQNSDTASFLCHYY
uniref:Cytochrome b5 heme-binding domain-containing protein n=1 Tax=Pseudo-nitzschia australis TaxID=44445 RepID=A0A7S4EFL6_9STRA